MFPAIKAIITEIFPNFLSNPDIKPLKAIATTNDIDTSHKQVYVSPIIKPVVAPRIAPFSQPYKSISINAIISTNLNPNILIGLAAETNIATVSIIIILSSFVYTKPFFKFKITFIPVTVTRYIIPDAIILERTLKSSVNKSPVINENTICNIHIEAKNLINTVYFLFIPSMFTIAVTKLYNKKNTTSKIKLEVYPPIASPIEDATNISNKGTSNALATANIT